MALIQRPECGAGVSDRWVWITACLPAPSIIFSLFIFIGFFTGSNIVLYSELVVVSISVLLCLVTCLSVIFIILDMLELKKIGVKPDVWMWLGLLIPPFYLFCRAGKTNRKYGYAITWCVLQTLQCVLIIPAWWLMAQALG